MADPVHVCQTLSGKKKKVLVIMGSTGTGKSKLSISLASHFPSEIINSDKIQVYKGFDIVTNKVPSSERRGIPHHLLGVVDDASADFTSLDFCRHALGTLALAARNGNLPIIVGGSNNYLKTLIQDPDHEFRANYDCCFIWLDVSLPVLFNYISKRVDEMLEAGLLDEIREAFVPDADYTRGVRRAIGVLELDEYVRFERENNEASKEELLKASIRRTKENTHRLAEAQREKILKLRNELGWEINKIDATQVFEAMEKGEEHEKLWEEIVFKPSFDIVKLFLEKPYKKNYGGHENEGRRRIGSGGEKRWKRDSCYGIEIKGQFCPCHHS
ncbi:adenylate isopentenyltransferase 5, chloroplastic-like [Senna tora]|uniref:adenylate dimethylallyltransferase (ADP/ATP-dependent) n=1 Tax=Senna tora TaxID=362788 RepID=A0A834TJM6_9FABA|nr:adenylate isopentenyltransferase 5, chloroplastic-like [Senna tora]